MQTADPSDCLYNLHPSSPDSTFDYCSVRGQHISNCPLLAHLLCTAGWYVSIKSILPFDLMGGIKAEEDHKKVEVQFRLKHIIHFREW